MYWKDDGAVIVSVFQDSDPQPPSGQRGKQGVRQGTGQEAASRQYRGRGRGNSQGRKEGGGVNFAANSSGGGLKIKEIGCIN